MQKQYKITLVLLISIFTCSLADLDLTRLHLVDYNKGTGNFFFRGNQPFLNGQFPYEMLVAQMKKVTAEQNINFPANNFSFVDISLDNDFEDKDGYLVEQEYFQTLPGSNQGQILLWPIGLSGIVQAKWFPKAIAGPMSDGMVQIDGLPKKLSELNQMMNTQYPRPIAIYIHCEAGCDRTGEIVGSYRLKNTNMNIFDIVSQNKKECGRAENYWSIQALKWYCVNHYYSQNNSLDFDDCITVHT